MLASCINLVNSNSSGMECKKWRVNKATEDFRAGSLIELHRCLQKQVNKFNCPWFNCPWLNPSSTLNDGDPSPAFCWKWWNYVSSFQKTFRNLQNYFRGLQTHIGMIQISSQSMLVRASGHVLSTSSAARCRNMLLNLPWPEH